MKSPITVYKLITLYMLDRAKETLAKSMIMDFLLDQGVTNNYLSSEQAISQLMEAGLVTGEAMGNRTMLSITEEGKETLHFFENELNPDIRRQCTAFLRENGMTIRDRADTTARYIKKVTGDYEVEMKIQERGNDLVNLTLDVPNEEIAKEAVQKWLEKNEKIYRYLVEELF